MAEKGIIDLLLDDHREFHELLPRLREVAGREREELFHYLVARLASHEAAEESVVHPALRDDVPGGDEFPALREHLDVTHRREMGRAFTTLRASGPTRPHPLTPQAPEVRAAVGPIAGIFDRARDAARDAFRR